MGTINYRTSEYITLGYKPIYPSDFEKDEEFMRQMQEEADAKLVDVDEYIQDWIYMSEGDMYDNVEITLRTKYINSFGNYFNVELKSGYYDWFSVQISCEAWPEDEEEKSGALEEADNLEKFLIECADFGLVECYPGWCTGYEDYATTVADIRKAMERVRQDIASAPMYDDKE